MYYHLPLIIIEYRFLSFIIFYYHLSSLITICYDLLSFVITYLLSFIIIYRY